MENVPAHVSVLFMVTTFVTVGIFGSAVRRTAGLSFAGKLVLFLLPFWMLFQAVLAIGGFLQDTSYFPPRMVLFGPLPAAVFIFGLLIFARKHFIGNFPLKALTILHVIRVPIEIVLYELFRAGSIPEVMTFSGANFDILSGVTAPMVYWFAFRNGKINRPVLIAWNLAALVLLVAIVTLAVLAFPSPMQQIALNQPNRAVMYFPYVWLPTVVVPIVLFAHVASLYKLLTNRLA